MVLSTYSAMESYDLDDSRIVGQGPICTCSRCGWGLLDSFTLYLFSSLSPSLWETVQYRRKYCLRGPLNLKQPTNQI